MSSDKEKRQAVAVVGGGRWARILLSVLATLNLPYELVVVSKANPARLADLGRATGAHFVVVPEIDDALNAYDVVAAVVVNAARLHAQTALRLVEAGISVLVEKPVALDLHDVDTLFLRAAENGVHVMPALTFLHCSYLHRFARTVAEAGTPVSARIDWCDAAAEVRYGEDKMYDAGISVAQDVMPHVWSILTTVLGGPNVDVRVDVHACDIAGGGRSAAFDLVFGGMPCRVTLQREGLARQRSIAVALSSGSTLTLDFTTEPGTVTAGTHVVTGDPDWERVARPVKRQLQAFVARIGGPVSARADAAARSSVAISESADRLLKREQESWLAGQAISRLDDDVKYAVRELMASRWDDSGAVRPGDRAALDQQLEYSVRTLVSANAAGNWQSAIEALRDPKIGRPS
ncbi:Gfo/Idh/MocA family oxidoreductase [Microvirga antarctica]|uniref:Gfo/Idh/MocA family oxidoreductase n=1 Tax=Microvirga antarctica TaxID=2819233 RepID=UPI001B315B9E